MTDQESGWSRPEPYPPGAAYPNPGEQPQPGGPAPYPPGHHPPPPQGGWAMGAPPENHLVWAILTTVLCCWPLGVVAILRAARVESLWFQGLPDKAHESADQARKWAIWSAVVPVVITAVAVLIFVIIANRYSLNR